MKALLLAASLLLAGLMNCGGQRTPKFSNPIVVIADNTPIYATMDRTSQVLLLAHKGDTLEFSIALEGVLPTDLGGQVYRVKPDARRTHFPHDATAGYIERRFITIPGASLTRDTTALLPGK